MVANAYWSVEECGWVATPAGPDVYWSVQRCRWEPVGEVTEGLPTPWSMFRAARSEVAAPAEVALPEQRVPGPAVVDA